MDFKVKSKNWVVNYFGICFGGRTFCVITPAPGPTAKNTPHTCMLHGRHWALPSMGHGFVVTGPFTILQGSALDVARRADGEAL